MLKRSLFLGALAILLLDAPAPAKLLYVGDKGLATVGKLTCPAASACRVAAPKRVKVEIAGIPVKVKAVLRREGKALTKVLRVRLRRAALAGQPGGSGGPPTSGPLGNEPPPLARPARASASPTVRSGSTRRPPDARTGSAPAMRSCPTGSTSRRGSTPFPNQRAGLLDLALDGPPTISNGGKTFTYSLVRGTLTADGVNVFAGFYAPPDNDEFGCVSVSFTTP